MLTGGCLGACGEAAIWNTLDKQPPRIIAHRGASGYLPEHSATGYRLAMEQGADVIEPDLVVSRDGVLYVHHDLGLSKTTDVAAHAEFADRTHDDDWWVGDFDAAELDRLRLVQRWPQRDHGHDGRYVMPRFAGMLDQVLAFGDANGRALRVYPEIKHPAHFRRRGHDPLALLLPILEAHHATGPDARVWLQCLDHAVLREAHERCGNPCYALIEEIDPSNLETMLEELSAWAQGIAPDKNLLWDAHGHDSGLVRMAHDLGLEVHAWTFRDDVDAPPFAHPEDALRMALSLGVDALFCDFPDTALAMRHTMAR